MSIKKIFHRDRLSEPVGQGVVAGITQSAYIALVAIFIAASETAFAAPTSWSVVLGIIAFLSLFCISAAVSAVVVFGRPFYYFSQQKYREALSVFLATIVTIFVVFAILFLSALLFG